MQRPIAVFMSFLAVAIIGMLALIQLPVSLMPETETPQLRIEVTVPDGSPMYIEQSVLGNLRTSCQGLLGIKKVSSVAASSGGHVLLTYEYGTDMKRAYVAANEKIDQSMPFLPREIERPVVRRVLQTDIPIVRLQLTSSHLALQEITQLARNVVKRRLEQIAGVSLVEWNGATKDIIRITPDRAAMLRYNISEDDLTNVITSSNTQIAQIKVNEGLYQYDLTFENVLKNPENLKELRVFEPKGASIRLSDLAQVERSIAKPTGGHWFRGRPGIVLAVHKRESADFNQLEKEIAQVKHQLSHDFPQVSFEITQSQSELLNSSIEQLATSLILGIILASLILLLFSSNWKSSLLMILLIPMAMLICFASLSVSGLSINIITLSGMILGVGILIDNGIILIDNIRAKRKTLDLFDACLNGTIEIIPALVSSAGTTLCVFIPLLFLEGIGGTLFQQQAFTYGSVLLSSILVSFLLLPLLYLKIDPSEQSENAIIKWLTKVYASALNPQVEKRFAVSFLVLVFLGGLSFLKIDQNPLPEIKTSDAQVSIIWGEVMTLQAQQQVIAEWIAQLDDVLVWESDIGHNEIYEKGIPGIEKSLFYLRFSDFESKEKGVNNLLAMIGSDFPEVWVESSRAKNPYDQLVGASEPYAVFDLRKAEKRLIESDEIKNLRSLGLTAGLGFQSQRGLRLSFNLDRIHALGLSQDQFIDPLRTHFGDQLITTINLINERVPVMIRGNQKKDRKSLEAIRVPLNDSTSFPVAHFVKIEEEVSPRYITADEAGIFQSLELRDATNRLDPIIDQVYSSVVDRGWLVSVRGSFEGINNNLRYLSASFSIVLILLFVILAAQFESLKKPLIILTEIPISLSGSLIFLWVFGQSLNLSSMMGIIIMLGIIVNDSILKVDSINRYLKNGKTRDDAIKQAGEDRLKPILMTTLTTILALLPILWSSGLGSDIQRPLCIAVIGGLSIGTICSIYLVPFLYRMLTPQTIVT